MTHLADSVAIVTGGATGIGFAIAKRLASEGAKIVIADLKEEQAEKTASQIRESGAEAIFLKLDVTNEENWKSVINTTVSKYGKLDILVNNAGVYPDPGLGILGTPDYLLEDEGICYYWLNKFEESVESFGKLKVPSRNSLFYLAASYSKKGETKEAKASLAEAVSVSNLTIC